MTPTPIFHGRVTEHGELRPFDTQRQQRRAYLRTLSGHDVEIIVRRKRRQRSLSMNAYLHAVPFPILADFFGDSIEETKRDLMGECFGWRYNDKLKIQVPVKPHTAEMTDEESKFFLDWLIPWAATKWQVSIPLPAEVA